MEQRKTKTFSIISGFFIGLFIMSIGMIIGLSSDEIDTYAAASYSIGSPYNTIALKLQSNGCYLSCDVGSRLSDGKYEYMNNPSVRADAKTVQAYEMFDIVPCSEDGNKFFSLRSTMNRKYLSIYRYNDSYGVNFTKDFMDSNTRLCVFAEGQGFLLAFAESDVFLCVDSNNSVGVTRYQSEATWFEFERVKDNNYSNRELAVLASNDWFKLDGGPGGYWNIQEELGRGDTRTLNLLGYNTTLTTIDNMELVSGLKKVNGKYEVLIAFQGTGGYGDDEGPDIGSNLTGWGDAKENLIHEGYYKLCKKLRDKEDEVFLLSEDGSNLSLKFLINEAKKGNAHFTLLGHSMGGALAQIYALFLNIGHEIDASKITGRTFNPALAITADFEEFTDWYNICVSSDSVPNGNVPGSINSYGIHRIGKTIWLYDKEPDVLVFYEGFGKYNNIAKNKHEMGADYALYNMLNNIQEEIRKKNNPSSDGSSGSGSWESGDDIEFNEEYFNKKMFETRMDYTYVNGEKEWCIFISKYVGDLTNVVIPEKMGEYKVRYIEDKAFENCEFLESIELPGCMYGIGENAFKGCTNLKNVELKDGLITIEEHAFTDCVNLKEIVIPDSVKKLGNEVFGGCVNLYYASLPDGILDLNGTFNGCTSLVNIIVPDSVVNMYSTFCDCTSLKNVNIPNGVECLSFTFNGCTSLEKIDIPNSVKIIEGAFTRCKSLKTLTIPDSVTKMGYDIDYVYNTEGEFEGCSNLESIVLSDKITKINRFMFDGCIKLESIDLPDDLKEIDIGAFNGCENLKSIIIPQGVTKIGGEDIDNYRFSGVFEGCKNLEKISIPSGVSAIYDNSFKDCSKLKSIDIPAGVVKIGKEAFYNCCSLENVILPESVSEIGTKLYLYAESNNGAEKGVFENCTSLETINIPGNVSIICEATFRGCKKLKNVTISDGVTKIECEAFSHCTSLESINIPDSVVDFPVYDKYFNNAAGIFYGCSSLRDVKLSNNVAHIDFDFIDCTSLESIIIPQSVTSMEYAFVGCTNLSEITVPSGVSSLRSTFRGCINLENITLLDGVKTIDELTFRDCHNLKSINIPGSVSKIPSYAFCNCTNLKKITISEGVKEIDGDAFEGGSTYSVESLQDDEGCINIEEIYFPDSIIKLKLSFNGFKQLKKVRLPETLSQESRLYFCECEDLESIDIPEGINYLGTECFKNCKKISRITIPDSVKTIDSHAFEGCESLESMKLPLDLTFCFSDSDFKGCSSLKFINIPNGITYIGNNVFEGCSSLESINIHKGITHLGTSIFEGCSSLKTISIPGSVNTLNADAFKDCTELTEINLSEGLLRIDLNVFWGCEKLKKLRIPKSVNSMLSGSEYENVILYVYRNSYAEEFAKNSYLKYEYIEEEKSDVLPSDEPTPTHINKPTETPTGKPSEPSSTPDTKPTEVPEVPSTSATPTPTQTVEPDKQQEADGVGTISADGKTLTDTDGDKYLVAEKITSDNLVKNAAIADNGSAGKYKITKVTKKKGKITGGTVTYMKPYNKNSTSAVVKDTVKLGGVKFKVTVIANNAFKGSKIKKLTIGKYITKIGKNAANGSTDLKDIKIRTKVLKKIGSKAFKGINAKAKFKVSAKNKVKKYKKMIQKAGAPKKAKVTK